MNKKYFDGKLALLLYYLVEPQNIEEAISILRQIATDQREACVGKLKQAWVNTNGKYDVNKAIEVVRNAEIGKEK